MPVENDFSITIPAPPHCLIYSCITDQRHMKLVNKKRRRQVAELVTFFVLISFALLCCSMRKIQRYL